MERLHLWRRWIPAAVAIGGWLFLLLSVASFHATDWPSHAVYPYPATQNLCGSAGAVVAYGLFLLVGQGAFPILLFTGICVVLFVAQNRVSDPWMRTVGLVLLAVSFAAAIHGFQPGSETGLPEGQGGILGIGAATFLQAHFSTAGTRLVLATAILVGLLLAADDLVVKGPAYLMAAVTHVRENRPATAINVPNLNGLGRLAREAASKVQQSAPIQRLVKPDEDPEEMKAPVRLSLWPRRNRDSIDLTYDNDEPAVAAAEPAHMGDADPTPAVAAIIPPPPPPPTAVFNGSSKLPAAVVKVTATPVAPALNPATIVKGDRRVQRSGGRGARGVDRRRDARADGDRGRGR